MKKSILIVSHALELGGAERSLIGLLGALDAEQWEIDLFLLRHEGELMDAIPDHIHILPEVPQYSVLARPMKNTLKEGHFILTTARLIGKIFANRYVKKHNHVDSVVPLEYSHKFTCPFMPAIQAEKYYDLAISFLTPHYFVARKVKAKKKIAWIHTDYSQVQVNIESETKMWDAYDQVISISENVSDAFLKTFPKIRGKLNIIENILPENVIRKQAEEKIDDLIKCKGEKVLLSIGRFSFAKNFDNIPWICKKIVESGFNVKWYLIGYGSDEDIIRKNIIEAEMEEHVILLGKKVNPYPYIKACDVYVQPSRYEGKCVTVREAQMLGKPVVITKYATSASQLEDSVDGIIVPMDNDRCAKEIVAFLQNERKIESIVKNCLIRDYSNAKEVEKIYKIMR